MDSKEMSALDYLNSNKYDMGVFLDVGANVGEFSEYVLGKFDVRSHVMFEPILTLFNQLAIKFSDSDVVNKCVSDKSGEMVEFYNISSGNGGFIIYTF